MTLSVEDDKLMAKVIIIEAFYGGSHKQLLDSILEGMEGFTIYDYFLD